MDALNSILEKFSPEFPAAEQWDIKIQNLPLKMALLNTMDIIQQKYKARK
jgi:hypothetical protein